MERMYGIAAITSVCILVILIGCIEEKCRSSLEFRGSDGGVFSMFPLSEQLLSGTGAGCGGRD